MSNTAPDPSEQRAQRIAAAVDAAWALGREQVLSALAVDADDGLSAESVRARRQRFGPNALRRLKQRGALAVLVDQFKSVVVALLVGAAALALAFGELLEAAAILGVIAINAGIGFFTELRALRSMEALRALAQVETTVRRDGSLARVSAESLVPGDVVLLEGGDVVTADLRLLSAQKLQIAEASLTGEALPVTKNVEPLPGEAHLTDRSNMAFKATAVARGTGVGVVVATGHATEIGHVASLLEGAEPEVTPLEKRLDALGRGLVWVTLGITTAIAITGVAAGREALLAIQVAVALAVAAIPEGLPIVATIALARGMWRMARHNALIARLSAVETLGATGIILTDKTGTLTENRMQVSTVALAVRDLDLDAARNGDTLDVARHDPVAHELLTIAALCNNAELGDPGDVGAAVGDPTEVALLLAARDAGIIRDALARELPEVREEPFDPDSRLMATFHREADGYLVAVKGAPEAVIECCRRVRGEDGSALDEAASLRWRARANALAETGARTLAIASRRVQDLDADAYRDLELLGLVALTDPPRKGVREAIARCRSAGIRIVMVTGDHLATARSIAADVGLIDAASDDPGVDARELGDLALIGDADREVLMGTCVVARASPEQKLELLRMQQEAGSIVAMTGDGVNDAPALKKADIGIAMGVRGTQVAKEAAAMVLADDELRTIVEAVAQGRVIYANIRQFVVYLMSCNTSELLLVAIATLAGAPLPLLPMQILFLNLVTDVFPALALGVGEGAPGLMRQPPRDAGAPVLTTEHWLRIALYGALISICALAAMFIALRMPGMNAEGAVTVSFLTLALAQLWHVINMRSPDTTWYSNEIVRNPWVWAAIVLCVALLIAAMQTPLLARILKLSPLDVTAWALVIGMSLLPALLGGAIRYLTRAISSP